MEYLLIRKYLYSKGLLGEDKKYLTNKDNQEIKDIRDEVKQKTRQSKVKYYTENTY